MDLKLKADLLSKIQGYSPKKREKRKNGLSIIASDKKTKEKVLLRVVENHGSKRGVDVATADKIIAEKEEKNCDRGICLSNKFTASAKKKLVEEGIRTFSEGKMPGIGAAKLYSTTEKLVDELCKAKCGKVPKRETDCKGFSDDAYSCEVRQISDNASFHLDKMWMNLLLKDTQRLFILQRALSN